ncbi:MAG: hypothetical protein J0I04_02475 [Paenarthrobacter ureafaciens]|uniref:hypothetical protein n=1 Tax=Paenarthrobacter ureafaciens TaxID=37931 RepID=UPI001ACF3A0A|nr:hypothetical protein [Paenarthrobacter ureafaciens]MBN9128504.1 hypothetical protein [Paenarthrobacter ureafaciens]
MNRAERRQISRRNAQWLKALWASDAPLDAKRLGSELAAEAGAGGEVSLVTATFVLSFPQQQPTVAVRSR